MKQGSLESHVKRLALGWTIGGIIMTLTLSGSLSLVLMFKDTERQIDTLATSALISDRTEVLSGNIRSTELRLKKEFGIKDGESLLFLDEKRSPWVGDLRTARMERCPSDARICRNWLERKIVIDAPIYFDDDGKNLWGYLHIEKSPEANWSLVLSVALAVIVGMLFQGLGFYYNLMRSIHRVSETLISWAKKLSANPKDQINYQAAPFTEIEPIGTALAGLKSEIDALEKAARQQGALTTLRGVGHDILNPVSRMKRILGLLEIDGSREKEHLKVKRSAQDIASVSRRENADPVSLRA